MTRAQPSGWDRLIAAYAGMTIPYPKLKAITLAQWILESARGTSKLAVEHNNFAGLKYRDRMKDHATPIDYIAHDGEDTYCKFKDVKAFIAGYWHFIDSGPYGGYKEFADDPAGYIAHLQKCGYAGDAKYASKVLKLQGEAQQLLGGSDDGDEPERPPRSTFGDYAPPYFEKVAGIEHVVRGVRPKGLEGLIVHFDAYRIKTAGNGPENSDIRTVEMLRTGEQNKYHYGGISRSGRVFIPENFKWNEWGYHAGPSKCPVTQRLGVSEYYVGFELNNPGRLLPVQEDGVFCPWYNLMRNSDDRPILDSKGRGFRKSEKDEWYTESQARYATGGNIAPGWYLPYSDAQFEALTNVIGYLLNQFPDSFSISKVLGHDEVSPGRKNDPGGALATSGQVMTMADFRAYLNEKF